MPKLPQFEEEQPQLRVQGINSKTKGYDAFSQFLGDLANKATNETLKLEDEQSNAQLMQSANMAEDLKTSTQKQLLENPNQAKQIYQNAQFTYKTIKESSYLNKEDKQKLERLINTDQNYLDLDSTKIALQQNHRIQAAKWWDEYPITSKQIQDSLDRHDFKTAEELEGILHKNAYAAAQSGIITPEQYRSIWQVTFAQNEQTKELAKALNSDEGITARQYHANRTSPFGSDNPGLDNQPVDHNTAWEVSHINNDRTFQGQFNALYNDDPINFSAVTGQSPEKFNQFLGAVNGIKEVKGAIRAGTPFNLLTSEMNALASKKGFLDARDTAKLKYWQSINKRLLTDNGFYDIMNSTVIGAQNTNDHEAQTAAIMTSGQSGQQLMNSIRSNDNNYIGNMIANAHSMKIDPNFIKPIPSAWRNEVLSSFQEGAPILPAMQRLSYINSEYRSYLADVMDKPNQGMAIYISGLSLGNTDNSFIADLIQSNQNRTGTLTGESKAKLDSSLILSGEKGTETKPNNLWENILNSSEEFKNFYSYLAAQPGGLKATDGLKAVANNYVYWKAQKSGDVTLDNKDQYINDFVTNTLKGVNIYRTDKAMFNLNDIQVARQQDADYLTHYALSEAYKKIHDGRDEVEFQRYIDLNPLMVVSTPDKRLVVTDRYGRAAVTQDGHEAFDVPYTSSMLSAAQVSARDIDNYLSGYGMGSKMPFKSLEHQTLTSLTLRDIMRIKRTGETLKDLAKKSINKARGKNNADEPIPEPDFPVTPQDVLMKNGR